MVEVKLNTGNLLEADVQALVNSVNTVGVMGKGVALQFKQAFPENFVAYQQACKLNQVQPGKMFVVATGRLDNPRYIINFPTKRHWRQKSRIDDIRLGLIDLLKVLKDLELKSVALPPLGCGNGGLEWSEVRPLIERAFESLVDVEVHLFQPTGSPDPLAMPVGTSRPRMTPGRAGLLGVLGDYAVPGYRLALLEIHKLAYFLQTAGEPLRLNFGKDRYGPYAENLNYVLQRIEGHYIRGYGDRTGRGADIHLNDAAVDEARNYLQNKPATLQRFGQVKNLIDGYETPYGLELLATIHWVAMRENLLAQSSVDQAVDGVHRWNKRKKELFSAQHIHVGWNRLKTQAWF